MTVTILKVANKTQTLGKKPKEDDSKEPNCPGKTQLKPFIDKLSIVFAPDSEQHAYDIHNHIWAQFADTAVFQSAGPKALKGGWRRAHLIALTSTLQRPLLQYSWEKGDHGINKATKFRLDLNPRKLGEQGLVELDSVVTSLWPDGWEYVLLLGRITRIDIAVDIPNTRMDEFLFIPKQGASEIQWVQDGTLQRLKTKNRTFTPS